jgi:hypothetical protein
MVWLVDTDIVCGSRKDGEPRDVSGFVDVLDVA